MSENNIKQAIKDISAGKMIVVTDDKTRENEGDLIMAAEKTTPEAINFMKKYGRGMINLCVDEKTAKRLHLHPMTDKNTAKFGTNFTVTIDAKIGTTTGSSAHDHAKTITHAADIASRPEDFVRPGHVLPIIADTRGVLGRTGHTESAVDLARLAGFEPVGVLCEIIGENGHMAKSGELETLAQNHGLSKVSISDIIEYRLCNEIFVEKLVTTSLPTKHGKFVLHLYIDLVNKQEHIALVLGDRNDSVDSPTITRIHSSCLTGDVFGSHRCDCRDQLQASFEAIQKEGKGIIIYLDQEGRGIGLTNKLKAYMLQDEGFDTVEANEKLGFKADERRFWIGAHILKDLGVESVRLLTNNPQKILEIETCGITVKREPFWVGNRTYNQKYIETKRMKMGHLV